MGVLVVFPASSCERSAAKLFMAPDEESTLMKLVVYWSFLVGMSLRSLSESRGADLLGSFQRYPGLSDSA